MTYAEIHTLAAHGDPLPPFQSLPDRACYESLCCLKHLYELTGLDEKTVRVRKQDIRRAHEEAAQAFRQYMAVYRAYSGNSRAAGQAVREMAQALEGGSPDYKALFWLAAGVIAKLTGDDVMVNVLRRKAAETMPESCAKCGYIEESGPMEADAFCPNCRARMDGGEEA